MIHHTHLNRIFLPQELPVGGYVLFIRVIPHLDDILRKLLQF